MRLDLKLITDWVKPGSRVLDLGCGNGQLLEHLAKEKNTCGIGVDINPEHITTCISKGISVIEQDLNNGLANFSTNSFDYVFMTQALQTIRNPHLVLGEMLRIGKEGVISFPNFGHWRCRTHLGLKGQMPVSKFLPDQWYDTPNIHFCTIKDFEILCKLRRINVMDRAFVAANQKQSTITNTWPNLLALTAVYHISSN